MVAKISCGRSIKSALHYNESKLAEGKATLILSSRFGCDADDLTVRQKLARFDSLIKRNKKVKTNTVHISLNFAPGEQLALGTLQYLAADYMQRIGFADQPFLVYQHHDAGHPHIHIVTTNIRTDGKAISLHNIGREKSEPARKALEQIYGLVVAEGRCQRVDLPAVIKPVIYGKAETKAAISNIVREITSTFRYTSLEELNAVLRCYNVVADPGLPGSRCWSHRGLTYSIVDSEGGKVGIPIAASSIYGRPVLAALEKKMDANRVLGIQKRRRLRQVVEKVLASRSPGAARRFLERASITCHQAKSGGSPDLFLIDHLNRTVISVRGEGFRAPDVIHSLRLDAAGSKSITLLAQTPAVADFLFIDSAKLLHELTTDTHPQGEYLPSELLKRKKRRRKP
ncbi:relaxase/mobilization nuclease domain-containing protein [Chitinophaga cymbidii]|uniref:relaxase/mobilization nuclease domain-containing protein n=1 Tax=Chitinophaga cymbidii TaxID=1096750 RepID=UPI0011BECB23|nr:relaxase/mobilization nuclease domain-containing protein [Chitinophaga cymbidii]